MIAMLEEAGDADDTVWLIGIDPARVLTVRNVEGFPPAGTRRVLITMTDQLEVIVQVRNWPADEDLVPEVVRQLGLSEFTAAPRNRLQELAEFAQMERLEKIERRYK